MAYALPFIRDDDIIVTADVDAFVMTKDIYKPCAVEGKAHVGVRALKNRENIMSKNLGTMTFDVLARPDGTKVDPGKALDFSTQGADGDLVVITDGSTAATSSDTGRPSLSIPGELTFMFGADAPERADYKAKNSRES